MFVLQKMIYDVIIHWVVVMVNKFKPEVNRRIECEVNDDNALVYL